MASNQTSIEKITTCDGWTCCSIEMKLDVYTLTLRKAVVNDIVNRLLRENVLYNTYLYYEVRTPPITS
jgi:hypothetical protein